MTWEENRNLDEKPWDARTLTRGMEFSSYAFATDRKTNVELGTLLDTPAFMWLDAFEKKHTRSAFLGALGFVCVCVCGRPTHAAAVATASSSRCRPRRSAPPTPPTTAHRSRSSAPRLATAAPKAAAWRLACTRTRALRPPRRSCERAPLLRMRSTIQSMVFRPLSPGWFAAQAFAFCLPNWPACCQIGRARRRAGPRALHAAE